jgi:hypothetical protein
VMWYLPMIDHIKHVFFNPRDADLVHWHSEKHRKMMRRFDTLWMKLSGKILIFNIQNLERRVEI